MREKPFKNRDDAHHVLTQLPLLAPREKVHHQIMAALDAWEPGRGNLVIAGPPNAGKTSGASIRCRDLLEEELSATSLIFAEAQELVENASLRERAMKVRFLVVDDLGQEQDPKNHLFRVYNARYKEGLETITTTGRRLEDLEKRPNIGSHMIKRLIKISRRGRLIVGSTVDVFKPRIRDTRPLPVGHPQNPPAFNEAGER